MKSIFPKNLGHQIGIDLGTTNTRIYVKDRGIIVNEPSVVAMNTKTEQILAVGNEAKNMLGKTPPHIRVTRPLLNGIVSDYEVAEKMIAFFLDKISDGGFSFFNRPRVVVGVPLEVTEVEMKAVEDAILSAGAKEVHLVYSPVAAAVGARLPLSDPLGSMIVDIGGGTTEAAVLSLNGVVMWKSTSVAGEELNRNIMQYARDVFNLFIGESQAEQLKIKIGSAAPLAVPVEFPMRGRDVVTGLPKEIMVTDEHIRVAMQRSLQTIVNTIVATLEVTPPELTADIHERGLLLSGGGSLLKGLDAVIAAATDIPVRITDDPVSAVVRGAGILLENSSLLNDVVLPTARRSGGRIS